MFSIKALEVALWVKLLLAYTLRFVLRWRKDYQLRDAAGNLRLTWKIAASANAAGRSSGSGMRGDLAGWWAVCWPCP